MRGVGGTHGDYQGIGASTLMPLLTEVLEDSSLGDAQRSGDSACV